MKFRKSLFGVPNISNEKRQQRTYLENQLKKSKNACLKKITQANIIIRRMT